MLHVFVPVGNDGANPYGNLIFDSKGALYGTTSNGGTLGTGTVFKLTPPAWTETVLYNFKGGPAADGSHPLAGLISDSKGALYGTTEFSGNASNGGTVFKLTPPVPPQTQWTETVLYRFQGGSQAAGSDGAYPLYGSLIFDKAGALYGTTSQGGLNAPNGTVFKLTPPVPPKTQWTETVLYVFKGLPNDGFDPYGGLIFDSTGALYGTTAYGGGPSSLGTVFKLTPPAPGHTQWTETMLHVFQGGNDGSNPAAGLIFDSKGTLYGTTSTGGLSKFGTVFKLTPPIPPKTQWTETVPYSFLGGTKDGEYPSAGLILDNKGGLYSTTNQGGTANVGTVFKLTPPTPPKTQWAETVVYSFLGADANDGQFPQFAGPVFDNKGALYGTTSSGGGLNGGSVDRGTVFELH